MTSPNDDPGFAGTGFSGIRLDAAFDTLPLAIALFDSELRLAVANAAYHELTGIPASDSTGHSIRDAFPNAGGRVAEYADAALHGSVVTAPAPIAFQHGSDRRLVEATFAPIALDSERRGVLFSGKDVTEREDLRDTLSRNVARLEEEARRTVGLYERVSTEADRLEKMVQERTRELMALQEARARERRLAAVGQLAAGVMHDVNNALNPIVAAAWLLEVNAENPAAVRDYAVRIAKAAETGAATAARVGRFIRQEPLKPDVEEPVDLSLVCDEVVAMTRPLWAERVRGGPIQLGRELVEPGVAMVRGIAGELREALLNLVQNALDAMAGGGALTLRTGVNGDDAYIEVRDSGIGMSAEVRERAFEPFFTTKGKGGTGLGLSEVYGIVKRHRGHATIESVPGAGATIRLVFPRVPVAGDGGTGESSSARRIARRVLVVEDHPDSREFMQALLESDGHLVDSAAGVQDAMTLLQTADPGYEVLVTDIGLPDGSGWDLISFARERWASMRIGVVTGWEPRAGAGAEGDFILRKPVRTSELLAQVAAEG